MSREEEYFEPGSVNGEDVKKFKKEEDDKSYEYFVAKDENNCVVGHAYVLKSAQGSIRLEKQCSNVKAIKKEEFLVKDEPPKITMKSSEPQDETIIIDESRLDQVCGQHSYKTEMFCKDCRVLVCARCFLLGDHKGHSGEHIGKTRDEATVHPKMVQVSHENDTAQKEVELKMFSDKTEDNMLNYILNTKQCRSPRISHCMLTKDCRRSIGKHLPSEQREDAAAVKIRAQEVAKEVGGLGEKFKCLTEKNSKVIIDKNDPQEQDSNNNSDSDSEEVTVISHSRWKGKDLINYEKYQCPYCNWADTFFTRKPPCRYQQRLHVLINHFSEDIYTALLTMLECTGGQCSLCGDREPLPQREGGWNNNYNGIRKKDYKMFTYRDLPLLTHFVARNHELTLTKGLVFSNNKLNQKNVDLLLDVLFPS